VLTLITPSPPSLLSPNPNPNPKGAVGLSLSYYDTSIAFINCHLASDSKGRSRVHRRNEEVRGKSSSSSIKRSYKKWSSRSSSSSSSGGGGGGGGGGSSDSWPATP